MKPILKISKNIYGIAKAKSEIIQNIKHGGSIVLNRDDKFFNYLHKKARKYGLKILTFGFHKKSDVRVNKIIKKGNMLKLVVNIDNETLNFEIGDINVYNILSSIAVLKELKIDIHKFKNNFKDLRFL